MSQLHSITSSHKNSKHLSFEECIIIQPRIKNNYSIVILLEKSAVHQQQYQIKLNMEQFLCIRIIFHIIRLRLVQAAYKANRDNSCRIYDYITKL